MSINCPECGNVRIEEHEGTCFICKNKAKGTECPQCEDNIEDGIVLAQPFDCKECGKRHCLDCHKSDAFDLGDRIDASLYYATQTGCTSDCCIGSGNLDGTTPLLRYEELAQLLQKTLRERNDAKDKLSNLIQLLVVNKIGHVIGGVYAAGPCIDWKLASKVALEAGIMSQEDINAVEYVEDTR